MRIGAIIQARTSSTRLPGKVLKELPFNSGITVLEQVIRRVKKVKLVSDIILATTQEKEDTELLKISEKEVIKSFCGSKDDVLSRYYLAAKENNFDVIVRLTSDCPCLDPEIVNLAIQNHLDSEADFTTNSGKNFPHGLDVEVINFTALSIAYHDAKEKYEREHVCPYIYKSNPHLFKISTLLAKSDSDFQNIRVTLDTEEDYALLCSIFDYLYYDNNFFGIKEIINLFTNKPWLKLINKKIIQKKIFNSLDEEIHEALEILKLQDLERVKELLEKHFL